MNGADNELILPDGRRLCYAEYGDPHGLPVFYFHGSPSSRLEPAMFGAELSFSGLRIIAPDGPGIGRSDWQESRTFADWAMDIVNLADHLGWMAFALMGNSGGGPYVAACAALIPERVTAAVVVSGAWRMDAPEVRANLPFNPTQAKRRLEWATPSFFAGGGGSFVPQLAAGKLAARDDKGGDGAPIWCDGPHERPRRMAPRSDLQLELTTGLIVDVAGRPGRERAAWGRQVSWVVRPSCPEQEWHGAWCPPYAA